MFAIIKTGGKQYKIQPGDIIKIENLGIDKGKKVNLNSVLAFTYNDKSVIGNPFLKNVEVKAEVLENKKNKKIIVFKKRRRHNSRRLNGHRQTVSVVKISEITLDGKIIGSAKKEASKQIKPKVKEAVPLKNDSTNKSANKKTKVEKKGVKNGS